MTVMPAMTEKDWQQLVIDYARLMGWLIYHTHDSRRSASGFPDLVLVRGRQLVFAELKTDTGRVRPEQQGWLDALADVADFVLDLQERSGENAGRVVGVYVWRPADWPDVQRALAR